MDWLPAQLPGTPFSLLLESSSLELRWNQPLQCTRSAKPPRLPLSAKAQNLQKENLRTTYLLSTTAAHQPHCTARYRTRCYVWWVSYRAKLCIAQKSGSEGGSEHRGCRPGPELHVHQNPQREAVFAKARLRAMQERHFLPAEGDRLPSANAAQTRAEHAKRQLSTAEINCESKHASRDADGPEVN